MAAALVSRAWKEGFVEVRVGFETRVGTNTGRRYSEERSLISVGKIGQGEMSLYRWMGM
jgi:hypothetical protein